MEQQPLTYPYAELESIPRSKRERRRIMKLCPGLINRTSKKIGKQSGVVSRVWNHDVVSREIQEGLLREANVRREEARLRLEGVIVAA